MVLKNKYYILISVFLVSLFFEYGCSTTEKCAAYGENYTAPDLTVGKIKKRRKNKANDVTKFK